MRAVDCVRRSLRNSKKIAFFQLPIRVHVDRRSQSSGGALRPDCYKGDLTTSQSVQHIVRRTGLGAHFVHRCLINAKPRGRQGPCQVGRYLTPPGIKQMAKPRRGGQPNKVLGCACRALNVDKSCVSRRLCGSVADAKRRKVPPVGTCDKPRHPICRRKQQGFHIGRVQLERQELNRRHRPAKNMVRWQGKQAGDTAIVL